MKVLFDALGATQKSGGMRLHAEEVVRNWYEAHPDDDLYVIGPAWLRDVQAACPGIRLRVWPNESAVLRIVGQLFVVPLVAAFMSDRLVCSMSPVLSPLTPRRRSFVVVHDWRHLKHPHQFSRAQKAYRQMWKVGARHANAVFAISEKTAQEVHSLLPGIEVVVAPNGGDHPRRWAAVREVSAKESPRSIVTFGHLPNKRAALAVCALPFVSAEPEPRLIVLGAEGEARDQLRDLAAMRGVEERCEFPGFVDALEYQSVVAHASVILLLSDDDGFGLPLAEAAYLGLPAIVTADGGVANLHAGAICIDPTVDALAAAITTALSPGYAAPHVSVATWSSTVATIRRTIAERSSG
jgi:glycosyltransferase involved in cell wall biosynthesis